MVESWNTRVSPPPVHWLRFPRPSACLIRHNPFPQSTYSHSCPIRNWLRFARSASLDTPLNWLRSAQQACLDTTISSARDSGRPAGGPTPAQNRLHAGRSLSCHWRYAKNAGVWGPAPRNIRIRQNRRRLNRNRQRGSASHKRRVGTCVCSIKTENNADISTTEAQGPQRKVA